MYFRTRHTIILSILLAAIWGISSCTETGIYPADTPNEGNIQDRVDRTPSKEFRNVFIVYSMGFNNLTRYLQEDIKDLAASPLMSNSRDVLLVFSHNANWHSGDRNPRYSEPTSPTLTRISKSFQGEIIRDTLMVLPDTTSSVVPGTLNKVLSFVYDNFEADGYGMLMSSHGTGWVPEDYCNHPYIYDSDSSSDIWRAARADGMTPKPFAPIEDNGNFPAVKSIGVQNISSSAVKEMDITEIAAAIPMKLDFIIFDACFMGGIEVAYQLRNVCDQIVFSQTEILADGMDYKTMTSYIFNGLKADLKGFCQNYYEFYDARQGDNRSATISLVDCSKLEPIAEICKEIFKENRDALNALEGNSSVQRYYRKAYAEYHQWFCDFYDIVQKCESSQARLLQLENALFDCILYKAATPSVLGITINTHSGFSMYLPYRNRTYLNDFYKTLDWNITTGLVQ